MKVSEIGMAMLIIFLLATACSNGSKPATAIPSTDPPPIMENSTAARPTTSEPRLEVVYFHLTERCVTCLCFEERFNYVMETYFKDQVKAGTITYKVLNAQKPENAASAKKYGAVGSQLFLNRIVSGTEQIKDIQEIWDWNCRGNKAGFDGKVMKVITDTLAGK